MERADGHESTRQCDDAMAVTEPPWVVSSFGAVAMALRVVAAGAGCMADSLRANKWPSAEEVLSAMEKHVVRSKGTFVKRAQVPIVFYAVALVHLAGVIAIGLYPLLVRTRRHDGWWVVALMLIWVHWMLLYGECFMSWLEKKLYYRAYKLGQEPAHSWCVDAFAPRPVMAGVLVMVAVYAASFCTVAARNVSASTCHGGLGVDFGLVFGRLGSMSAKLMLAAAKPAKS